MITPLSKEKIKEFFNLEFSNQQKLTQFGGSAVFIVFLRKIKFKKKLSKIVGRDEAKAICQVMLGIFAGAKSLRKIALVTKDAPFSRFLRKPFSETQIVRVLKNLKPSQIQALHEFTLSQGLLDIIETVKDGETITIDIDATSVEKYGKQEGVETGYISKDNMKPCYQYLVFRCNKPNTLLYGTIRGGAAHSQNGISGYLNMIVPCLGAARELEIKADSGYFSEESFEFLSENRTKFYIRAPMTPERRAQAQADHLVWTKDPNNNSVEWSHYDTVTSKGYHLREAFKRIRIKSKKNEMFPHHEYHCVVTNNLWLNASKVFKKYNPRAKIEQTIEEHKNDYFLGKIVTQSFDVNDIITQATFLLYQLVSHFKNHCLDKADSRCRLSTLRTIIFNVPARILSSARQTTLRVHNVLRNALYYGRLLARLQDLQTIFVLALAIDSS